MEFWEAESGLERLRGGVRRRRSREKWSSCTSSRRWAQPRQQYEGSCWSKNQAGPRRKGRSELGIGVLRQAGLAEWAAKTAAGTSWPKRKEQNSTGLKRARQTRSHKTSSGDACACSSKPKGGRQRVRGCVNASCVIMCTVQCKRQNTKIVGGGWVRKPHSGAREDRNLKGYTLFKGSKGFFPCFIKTLSFFASK